MLFNSFAFAVFLPLVFICYWALQRRSLRAQNVLLLVASYFFYGCWDWRFLGLIAFSSAVDYVIGIKLDATEKSASRKRWLLISVAVNLGVLGFFKYYGFFVESLAEGMESLGIQANLPTLRIILPVGISFYTFQSLSYTIDIYRRQIRPTHDALAFFTFVSFFPQLVAGPIERASHLLPQFLSPRHFDTGLAKDGLRQILWGLFKKIVIADNLAGLVENIFVNYKDYDASVLFLGTLYFAIQIYCDFSGYSDIAIGTARLFGFDLMRNFAYPYFSRDIGEFWRRWHISLSTWFRDYVYIPLGGSQGVSRWHHFSVLLITFVISGFWHGANWTFIVWGLLNGLFYLPLVVSNKHKRHQEIVAQGRWLPSLRETFQISMTFAFTLMAWVFFRADSLTHAVDYLTRMTTAGWSSPQMIRGIPYVTVLLIAEWIQREKPHTLSIASAPVFVRWTIYYCVIGAIFLFGKTGHVPFIYFQF